MPTLPWVFKLSSPQVTVPPEYLGNDVLERIIDLLKDKKPYLCVEPKLSLVIDLHKKFPFLF